MAYRIIVCNQKGSLWFIESIGRLQAKKDRQTLWLIEVRKGYRMIGRFHAKNQGYKSREMKVISF